MMKARTVKGRMVRRETSVDRPASRYWAVEPDESGPARAPDPQPSQIGPYRILKVLGEGGMGTVYLAEQTELLDRRVALKLIRSALVDPEAILRFEAERQALARMSHPNVAQVFEAGTTDDGRPFIVMEYVPGWPITAFCDRHQPATGQLLELLIAVARGIGHAHEKGAIHRDVKPSNVLVTTVDGDPIPKIIDFGIAKLTDATTQLTRAGSVLGTVAYMSPEQIRGGPIDHRTDVFSFGVLTHELLTHQLPFHAPAIAATLWRDYPPELERIVSRCLEKEPERRYPDFSQVVRELRQLLEVVDSAARSAAVLSYGDSLEALLRGGDQQRVEELEDELRAAFEAEEEPTTRELLAVLERGAELAPAVAHALVLRACRWQEDRDRKLCGEEAEALLTAADVERELGFALGTEHESAPEIFAAAAAAYREAIALAPQCVDAESHADFGDVLVAIARSDPAAETADQYAEAAAAYREALELDPGNARAHYGLALATLDDPTEIENCLAASWRAVELAPDSAAAHNHLGVAHYYSQTSPGISHYGQKHDDQAVAAYQKAIALAPDLALLHVNLGLVLYRQDKKSQALAAFRTAIRTDPDSPLSRQLSGLLATRSRVALRAAIDELRLVPQVIFPFPRDDESGAAYRRGLALVVENKLDEAREVFAEAARQRRRSSSSFPPAQ